MDVFVARRATRADPWSMPIIVPELSSGFEDTPGVPTDDALAMFMSSARDGGLMRIFVTSRASDEPAMSRGEMRSWTERLVVFGVMARSKAGEITNGANPDDPPVFDPELEARGKRYDLLAIVSWSVGGAAMIGGVVMYVLGKRAEQTRVSAVLMPDGVAVAWCSPF